MSSTLPSHPDAHTLSPSGSLEREAPAGLQIADLMRSLEPTIEATRSLRETADRIAQSDEGFAVVTLNEDVIGIISAEDVLTAAQTDPTGWQTQPSTLAIASNQTRLSPHYPVEEVLHEYRARGIRPLLVFDEETPVGLIRPAEVRTWCLENHTAPWDDLACQKVLREADPGEDDAS
ncbi:CBS domain-containing protein [Nesterenkonia natronophila]|uniref:CBS domain-containing protein n=1 Tax=Nesterenkonia natronophila TaxID=2174932 RepID=A0A3A4F4F1_9MICC|nr:CBS domain-containing protein [Nesterenkonia natronophila]RJN32953.1 CBS domain-containing protein [Nesterenkonia natronophila]